MSKDSRVYSVYKLDIGAGAFKRAFVTHRNTETTAVKRTSRTSENDGREKEEMLKEDLKRNVTLCLHNSFCRNRESNVDPLPCCKQREEEQKCGVNGAGGGDGTLTSGRKIRCKKKENLKNLEVLNF